MSDLSPMTGQEASIKESTVTFTTTNPFVTETDDAIDTTILVDLKEKGGGRDPDKERDRFGIMNNIGEVTRNSSKDQDTNDNHEIKNFV